MLRRKRRNMPQKSLLSSGVSLDLLNTRSVVHKAARIGHTRRHRRPKAECHGSLGCAERNETQPCTTGLQLVHQPRPLPTLISVVPGLPSIMGSTSPCGSLVQWSGAQDHLTSVKAETHRPTTWQRGPLTRYVPRRPAMSACFGPCVAGLHISSRNIEGQNNYFAHRTGGEVL